MKKQLTDTQVRALKPGAKTQKVFDGGGLYLFITPAGGKLWRWAYRYQGKPRTMAFGAYPAVSLADARDKHTSGRALLSKGIDPMAQRKAKKIAAFSASDNTFGKVALAWHGWWKSDKNPDYAADVKLRMERDLFPFVGHLPMDTIEAPMIRAAIKKIEERGAREIASRCLGDVKQVFRYAIVHGRATRNSMSDVKPLDLLKPRPVVHHARIDAEELPILLRKMENYEGTPVTRLALKLMALTFVRTSELIEARWNEFDFKAERWTIPAERMKQVRRGSGVKTTPHVVPLARQTVDALESLYEITGSKAGYLFPHQWSKTQTMSRNTILEALYRMGYKSAMTGHGFKGVAATVLYEKRAEHGFIEDHIELQLAHIKGDDVRAAYDYSKHLAERTKMMQWWADYLDEARKRKH